MRGKDRRRCCWLLQPLLLLLLLLQLLAVKEALLGRRNPDIPSSTQLPLLRLLLMLLGIRVPPLGKAVMLLRAFNERFPRSSWCGGCTWGPQLHRRCQRLPKEETKRLSWGEGPPCGGFSL